MPVRSDQWGSDMDDTNAATKKFKKELNSGIVALTLLSVLDQATEPIAFLNKLLFVIKEGTVLGIVGQYVLHVVATLASAIPR